MESKLNILLVENDALVYRHLERMLRAEGYHVLPTPSGEITDTYEKAVAILCSERVNLAILDIQLEGDKDGLDIGVFIHTNCPNLPFIFLSDYSNVQNHLRAGEMGSSDFLDKMEKPFTDNQLKRKLMMLRPKMEAVTAIQKQGGVFNVQEFLPGNGSADARFHNKIIKWKDIVTLTTYNPRTKQRQKNNCYFLMNDKKIYRCHDGLSKIEMLLPGFLTRFNDGEIVNVSCITSQGKADSVYYIDEKRFEINRPHYETALKAIRVFLHPKF